MEVTFFFRELVVVIGALLPIVNPLGSAPIFLTMSPGASDSTRATLARRIATNSWLLLAVAMAAGSYVLAFFGLSIAVIKIAGGLLVISTGWRLITADQSRETNLSTAKPGWDASEIASRSFFPLTFPLTIGPGSVSVAITLGAGAHKPGVPLLIALAGGLTGLIVVALAIHLAYRYSSRLMHVLGTTGTVVFLRLSAFILLSIGVQIFCDGLAERFAIFGNRPAVVSRHIPEDGGLVTMRIRNGPVSSMVSGYERTES